jgi:uncharacterized protein YvpB
MKFLGKALVIAAVFAGSLFALLEIKGETLSGMRLHRTIFIEDSAGWKKCKLTNAVLDEDSARVIFTDLPEPAALITNIIDAGFPFEQMILSWNAIRPDSSAMLDFQVELSDDAESWHRFDYQLWGESVENSYSSEKVKEIDGIGRINVDYLELYRSMRYARVIVTSPGNSSESQYILRRLAVSFSSNNANWENYDRYHPESPRPFYGTTKLAVPYFSQRNLPGEISGKCCSPTSLSMVLNYHGIGITPEETAHRVYDSSGNIYGNWPYNVAAAFESGLGRTWIDVHCSFDELYDEVAGGKPVIISVAFDIGELPRSPIQDGSDGHLIAVVGFDGPNTVICNDPAGHTAEDGIIDYPRKELENIWLRHGGVAYHLWPER